MSGFGGSHDFFSELALNEAAVQLMASEANMSNVVEEKYFDILLRTNSPDYYPLECSLVNELVYFTGTYPLYHSVLYNSDLFKNTFSAKFSKKMYEKISRQLDKLLKLENDLYCYIKELEYTEKINDIKQLNSIIAEQKRSITKLLFSIQNCIIRNCFTYEFNSIRDAEDLYNFKNKLYNFQNELISSEGYTFFNDFYCKMMEELEIKREMIKKYGVLVQFKDIRYNLNLIETRQESLNLFKTVIEKIKKLLHINQEASSTNETTE